MNRKTADLSVRSLLHNNTTMTEDDLKFFVAQVASKPSELLQQIKELREKPDPIESARIALNDSFESTSRKAALLVILEDGEKGSVSAQRILIEEFECGRISNEDDYPRRAAKSWLRAFVKAKDRTATYILGKLLFSSSAQESWTLGRQLLLNAAFDAEFEDTKWPRRTLTRERALRSLFEHYSKCAEGPEPDSEKALWYAELAIGIGSKGALIAKAREILLLANVPAAERRAKAICCIEEYLDGLGPKPSIKDWPVGYTLPEVSEAENLLEELRASSA